MNIRSNAKKYILIPALSILLVFSGLPADYVQAVPDTQNEINVTITKEYNADAQRLVVEAQAGSDPFAIAYASGGELVRTGPLNYLTLEFYPEDQDHKNEILHNLLLLPEVINAEWSTTYTTASKIQSTTINDPEYALQWGVKKVRADKVWQEGVTGEGIIVAVVDTGIDLNHPDFVDSALSKNNIVQGYNAITRSTSPEAVQDDHGHGTTVSGVIAALNNSTGIVGIAHNAKIMPIKAMNKDGDGEDSIIADGIIWAVNHGAKVINMSIGSNDQTKVLDDALKYAADQGVILVGASGNKKGYMDVQTSLVQEHSSEGVAYPGANPYVIAVSASDNNDLVTDFSRTGPEVELSAPGQRVLTNIWKDGESGLAYSTGTSIAAPFVSGAAALLLSKYPDLSTADIERALLASAYDLGVKGRENQYGFGRLDIYRALKYLEEPVSYSSPASIGWEGGNVLLAGTTEEPDGILSISPGTFTQQVDYQGMDKKITVSMDKSSSQADFPEGITPAGNALTINPWGEALAEKPLTLTVKLNTDQIVPNESIDQIAYLYKWSNTRWIRVGGGIPTSSPTMEVTIYEPGIYRAGWSPVPDIDRIAGIDRIHTAIEIVQFAFPTGADTVIIARSDDFPDALAGAPLAYKYQAPILLTHPNHLPAEVFQAVQDLAPKRIFILGGTGAVSDIVKSQLGTIAYVTRISGNNRYETAAAVADKLGTKGEAIIVNGANFPDAISAASHAAIQGKPILLSTKDMLTSSTEDVLRKYAVLNTEVIGGTGVLSQQVLTKLEHPKRISGLNRYGTSAGILHTHRPTGKIFYVSTGLTFPDALTGGILASGNSSNIMILHSSGPTPEQQAIVQRLTGKKIIALGGEGAVPEVLLDQLKEIVNI